MPEHHPEPAPAVTSDCERLAVGTAHAPHDDCPGVRVHPTTMIGGAHRPPTEDVTGPTAAE